MARNISGQINDEPASAIACSQSPSPSCVHCQPEPGGSHQRRDRSASVPAYSSCVMEARVHALTCGKSSFLPEHLAVETSRADLTCCTGACVALNHVLMVAHGPQLCSSTRASVGICLVELTSSVSSKSSPCFQLGVACAVWDQATMALHHTTFAAVLRVPTRFSLRP